MFLSECPYCFGSVSVIAEIIPLSDTFKDFLTKRGGMPSPMTFLIKFSGVNSNFIFKVVEVTVKISLSVRHLASE